MNHQERTIYGRLGKKPILRQTKNHKPFCTFTLVEEVHGNEKPRWYNIVMWEKESEHWASVLNKGMSIFVHGRISEKDFKTESGELKRYSEVNADSVGIIHNS